ncbi:MAG: NAD(P)H-binding protein [Actinomycetota bacterium]
MTVLVTGGTGNLGRELVPRLVASRHAVRVLSRRERPRTASGVETVRGDLVTGDGIGEALAGIEVLVHCASGTGTVRGLMYRSAKVTDVDATSALLDAAKAQGVSPHVVYISIVGIDKIPLGYYRAKLDTEKVIEASGLPYTILRTTQWHTLAEEFCRRLASMPFVAAPKGVRLQLLDPGEVADRMADLVSAPPTGHVPDMGGPVALEMKDVIKTYLDARGKKRPVTSMRFPGKTMRALREGHNLAPAHADGKITWEDWLALHAARAT